MRVKSETYLLQEVNLDLRIGQYCHVKLYILYISNSLSNEKFNNWVNFHSDNTGHSPTQLLVRLAVIVHGWNRCYFFVEYCSRHRVLCIEILIYVVFVMCFVDLYFDQCENKWWNANNLLPWYRHLSYLNVHCTNVFNTSGSASTSKSISIIISIQKNAVRRWVLKARIIYLA